MDRPLRGPLLLVGEGDFSLTMSIVHSLTEEDKRLDHQVISTSLETEESILKHRDAAHNMQWLKEKGVQVQLHTDATMLHQNPGFEDRGFNRIVFNFPHVGGKSNHKKNRKLLNDFFCSASRILQDKGQIMMTLCKGQGGTPADKPMRKWHDSWQVVSMAANADLVLTEIVPFDVVKFIQYKCTGFRSLDKGFNTEGAITHVFEKAIPVPIPTLEEFTSSVTYVPGERYCQEKFSRNLLKSPSHPVHSLCKQLTECLCDRFSASSLDRKQEICSTMGPYTAEPPGEEDFSKTDQEESVLLTEEVQSRIYRLCDGDEAVVESFCCIQPIPILPNKVPVCHVLALKLPIADSGNRGMSLENVLEETVTSLQSSLSVGICVKTCSLQVGNFQCRGGLALTSVSKCGKISQQCGEIYIVNSNNSKNFVAVLNLDLTASFILDLPDTRLLWSREEKVQSQLRNFPAIYKPVSLYPMQFTHDMSFWENESTEFSEATFMNIIRDVGGDTIKHVTLIDRYYSSEVNKTSRCYRLIFQSYNNVLCYNTSWKIQSVIRLLTAEVMKIELR